MFNNSFLWCLYNLETIIFKIKLWHLFYCDYLTSSFSSVFFVFCFSFIGMFACLLACAPCVCLALENLREGHQIPWNWNHGQLWALLWVLRIKPRSLPCKQQVLLTPESLLWPLSFCFNPGVFRLSLFSPLRCHCIVSLLVQQYAILSDHFLSYYSCLIFWQCMSESHIFWVFISWVFKTVHLLLFG